MGKNGAVIVLMTNRGRVWIYQKASRAIAGTLKVLIQKEIFLDMSWVEELNEGKSLLVNTLRTISEERPDRAIILIKDAKWPVSAQEIRRSYPNMDFYIADIKIETVEQFAETMDTDGLISHIITVAGLQSVKT